MAFQTTIWTIPLLVAAFITFTMFALTATQRGKKGAYSMMSFFLADVVWAVTFAIMMGVQTPEWKIFWHNVRFIGPTLVTLGIFVFALHYSGREEYVHWENVLILAAIPIVTNVLVWTNDWHGLVRQGYELVEAVPTGVEFEYGPWFYLHALYSYSLSLGAMVLFGDKWLRIGGSPSDIRRTQLMFVGTLVPAITSVLYVADVTVMDLTPFSFAVSGLFFMVAIFRY